mgnify:CR=1 FL=1
MNNGFCGKLKVDNHESFSDEYGIRVCNDDDNVVEQCVDSGGMKGYDYVGVYVYVRIDYDDIEDIEVTWNVDNDYIAKYDDVAGMYVSYYIGLIVLK